MGWTPDHPKGDSTARRADRLRCSICPLGFGSWWWWQKAARTQFTRRRGEILEIHQMSSASNPGTQLAQAPHFTKSHQMTCACKAQLPSGQVSPLHDRGEPCLVNCGLPIRPKCAAGCRGDGSGRPPHSGTRARTWLGRDGQGGPGWTETRRKLRLPLPPLFPLLFPFPSCPVGWWLKLSLFASSGSLVVLLVMRLISIPSLGKLGWWRDPCSRPSMCSMWAAAAVRTNLFRFMTEGEEGEGKRKNKKNKMRKEWNNKKHLCPF